MSDTAGTEHMFHVPGKHTGTLSGFTVPQVFLGAAVTADLKEVTGLTTEAR